MRTSVLHAVVAVAFVGLACDDTTAPATAFHATLTGAAEVPALSTPSTGAATAIFSITGGGAAAGTIIYTINITAAASSNYSVAHIHAGTATGGATPAGTGSGIVRVNLCGTGTPAPACPTGTGTVGPVTLNYASGSTAVLGSPAMTFDQLVAALRAFGAYINIHSATNGGGEIRGQVIPDAP